MSEDVNHHEALIYVMVTMSAVDRAISDKELARIGNIVSQLPIFADFDAEKLVQVAQACGERLGADGGLDAILDLIARVLPEKLYETAYALAVEIAAADLDVKQEELRFLQLLRDQLELDKLPVGAIEHSARVRHRLA
ncbi:MAG: tellurite resistance TerB family protein [Methyloligellaceae bacterium]